MTVKWGLVTTVKAPEDQILAFVAHHLSLGAQQIFIYFDDPDDPAFARVSQLPRVKAIRCTDLYWILRGGRPDRHQSRQIRNARHAISRCRLDWLGHLDIDEFLHAPEPVAGILAAVPRDVPSLQMDAFEAMHDSALPDDIFTARQFRGPLQGDHAWLVPAIFGPFADILAKGSLGHTLGKCFLRPRIRGVAMDLHVALVNGLRHKPPFHPSLRILHFHAQNPDQWRRALPFRLARGAYHHAVERPLKSFLSQATDPELRAFYQDAMTLTPEKAALLQAHDRLITADLRLRAKIDTLLAGGVAALARA
jgi:hypothetical protein